MTTPSKHLRVGITIGLHHAQESLWNNGIKQNALFLAEALGHCSNVASVMLVNTTGVEVTSVLPWSLCAGRRCPMTRPHTSAST